jgi:DnaJ-domain-containing protein 1
MRIRAIADAKVLENYRIVSSLRTGTDSKTRIQKKPGRISDTVEFSREALDELEFLKKTESDERIHQKQLQEKKDEEIRRSFEVLELDRGTPKALIKRAYHYLMHNYHPDKYSNLPPEFRKLAEVKAQQIIEAYNTLTR